MVAPFKKYITTLRRAKKKRRQFACVVTAMSVVVSGGVFWQLRGIGTAMTDSDLPGFDDSGGTALPLSNPSDLETAEIWEATIPPLSDNAGENLALIAESQLGYKESSSDFIHAEDGESHNGYTRYGAWYGNPYGDWNTLFTYFCMNYAGLKQEVIPYGSGCWAWSLELDKAGFITSVTRGSPKRGDILLIDSDGDGKADTSAIVCGTVEEGEAPGISVIEGDVDGCVAQKFYPYDHEGFIGTVSLDGIVPEPPVMNEAPALPTELLFSSDSDSGIHVEASADAGAFPDDTAMTVYDISQDEAVQAAAGHFGEDELDNISAVAVDITFTSPDGEELEPAEGTSVRVSISLPEEQALEGESFSLLHISDEGDIQQVEDAEVSGDAADFVTESFSVFVLVSDSTYIPSNRLAIVNGQFVNNSENNPYVIYLNDEVKVFMSGAYHVNQNDASRYVDAVSTQNPYTFTYNNKNKYTGVLRTFKAVRTGKVQLATNTEVSPAESIWLEIRDRSRIGNIYVKTEFEYKNIDMVKEYLGGDDGGNPYNLLEIKGHVPNGPGQTVTAPTPRPYTITEGEEFEIYLDKVSGYTLTNYNASFSEASGWNCALTSSNEQKIQSIPCVDEHGSGVTALRFKGLKPGVVEIKFTDCDKSMWVRVLPPDERFHHADMEIADGGKYTISKTEFVNGQKITRVEVYDALITRVNHSEILGSDPDAAPIQTYEPEHYRIKDDSEVQYELTSAYSNRYFNLYDAKHVTFDVNVELTPSYYYTVDSAGNVSGHQSLPAGKKEVKNVFFDLGTQQMIDAMNKCPMSNGFDFTVRANAAVVKLEGKKILTGKELEENAFDFDLSLIDNNNNSSKVVATLTNDADGNFSFTQAFSEPGSFSYTLKEVIKETDEPIIFDEREINITVNVTEVDGVLVADVIYPDDKIPEFTNHYSYTLPATGGSGTLPFIIFGSAMITGAAALYIIKRKKEVSC